MLEHYDAVLAFGEALSERYRGNGWGRQVFTWHEAADTRLFRPMPEQKREEELIWIGNWGDEERSRELGTFLIEPARVLGLTGAVYGVRYPESAREILKRCRLRYSGWLANADVPAAFARHRATVHIPRRPYVEALPGIPTIRVFEALACGIPLVCAPWADAEGLFRPGEDFLVARDSDQMVACLAAILQAPDVAASLAEKGLETVLARHTCTHRVDELLDILAIVGTRRVRRAVLPKEAAA
jgi:spore maturation protein CgeB